ncbi:MAG: hypothetical protein EBZ94_07600, partial [Crocinitomicaceae bacterium]|nr:hypothetical protein [Crocinitomicaceae bacterium]
TGSQSLAAVSGIVSGTAFGLGADYTGTLTTTPATAALTLNLNGTAGTSAATSPTYVATGTITALTINANATTTLNTQSATVLHNATAATLQGAGNVTYFGAGAAFTAGVLNASGVGYTGALTLRPSDNAAIDLAGDGSVVTGVRTIDLRDIAAFNSQITLAAANNSNIETVIGLAPAETNPSAIAAAPNVSVPALIFSGSADGVTPPAEHHIPIYNGLTSSCKSFVSISGGAHCYYANTDFNCDFGESVSSPSISITRAAQQTAMFGLLDPWLDFKLKGICESYAAFLLGINSQPGTVNESICPALPIVTLVNDPNQGAGVYCSSEATETLSPEVFAG